MTGPSLQKARQSARLSLAIMGARSASMACKALRRGGTSLPGLVGVRIAPRMVADLGSQLGRGSVVIAGTNGKTTTAALTAAALRAGGRRVTHNRAGSNMLRGIATTLAGRASLTGRLRDATRLMGLFEVDEAALPGVLAQLAPRVVVLTNLFRDQLDRYGELQSIAGLWRVALQSLPPTSTLVLNADDPLIASLAGSAPGRVVFFGVDSWDERRGELLTAPPQSADSLYCPTCAAPLRFSAISYAHLGHYACPACSFKRPEPGIVAAPRESGPHGSMVHVCYADQSTSLALTLPGRYNVYNALAALAAALVAGIELPVAVAGIRSARAAFGRAELVKADGRSIELYLIKNPTGADEVLRVVAAGDHNAGLLLLLNDNDADGHDVSWIWDTQFELLAGWAGPLYIGGTRAEDMALRCKYAGLQGASSIVPGDSGRAIQLALDGTVAGGKLYLLATYTAMLSARHALARAGHVAHFWKVRA